MIAVSLGWVFILIGIAFFVGLILGIRLGISWMKRKPESPV